MIKTRSPLMALLAAFSTLALTGAPSARAADSGPAAIAKAYDERYKLVAAEVDDYEKFVKKGKALLAKASPNSKERLEGQLDRLDAARKENYQRCLKGGLGRQGMPKGMDGHVIHRTYAQQLACQSIARKDAVACKSQDPQGQEWCAREFQIAMLDKALITKDPKAASLCLSAPIMSRSQVSVKQRFCDALAGGESADSICAFLTAELQRGQNQKFDGARCLLLVSSFRGEAADCSSVTDVPGEDLADCATAAAFRKAWQAKDSSKCGDSVVCLAMMGAPASACGSPEEYRLKQNEARCKVDLDLEIKRDKVAEGTIRAHMDKPAKAEPDPTVISELGEDIRDVVMQSQTRPTDKTDAATVRKLVASLQNGGAALERDDAVSSIAGLRWRWAKGDIDRLREFIESAQPHDNELIGSRIKKTAALQKRLTAIKPPLPKRGGPKGEGEKSEGDKSDGEKSGGDKSEGEKPQGDKAGAQQGAKGSKN